jgi:hypothetical protein
MAFWIGFALYSAVMAFVWGFFFVARMHVFKFKNYSTHVGPVTHFLMLFLLTVTVVGYAALFWANSTPKTTTVSDMTVREEY